jgi:hypothetical protein
MSGLPIVAEARNVELIVPTDVTTSFGASRLASITPMGKLKSQQAFPLTAQARSNRPKAHFLIRA